MGPARGGSPPRHFPDHLDLRPPPGQQREPQPPSSGRDGGRIPDQFLRHHHLRPPSRPAHGPPARALGPERGARAGAGGRRRAAPDRAYAQPTPDQRGEVAGGLAGVFGAPARPPRSPTPSPDPPPFGRAPPSPPPPP